MKKGKGKIVLKQILAKLFVFVLIFQMAVPVEAASAAEDFVIEDGVLVGYKGSSEVVEVPDTVNTIGEYAFNNCTMKKVILPDSVSKIEPFAFYQCANLEELVLPNVSSLDSYNDVMLDCGTQEKGVKIVVPELLTDDYFYGGFLIGCTYNGTQSGTPVYFEVSQDNEVYTSDNYGMLYKWIEDSALELCALAGGTIEEYVLPKNLEKITLDDHIENINSIKLNTQSALWKPEWKNGRETYIVFENLEKVIIPKKATKLANDMIDFAEVFGNVPAFELEEGNDSFVVENNVIYSDDKKTLLFYPKSKEDKEFEIPETVETIGTGAFLYVNDLHVILPENLKEIEQFSFYQSSIYVYTNGSEPTDMHLKAYTNLPGLCIDKTEDGKSEKIWIEYVEKIDEGRIHEVWLEDLTTILAPNYIDSPTLKLSGYGYFDTDKEMVFLCDGKPIDTVTPNPVTLDFKHRWAATLQLPITEETEDGTQFRIAVQIGENTSEEVIVTYRKAKLPKVIDASFIHLKEYSIDLEKNPSKVITYVGLPLLQVELELEDMEEVKSAYCTTNGDDTYPIKKDEKTGKWVVQIPLAEGAANLPEILKLECVVDTASGDFRYNFLNLCLSWIIDPSGYIYEAVPENKVEDAKMSIYYKEGQYADDSTAVLWDAEPYYQTNPIMTDANGRYAWDVPAGWWQVVAEKDGYAVTKSAWMEVPPPQLDVNLELVSTEKPNVTSVELASNKMKVVFDKYVKVGSVTNKISLKNGDEAVAISSVAASDLATRDGADIATSFEVTVDGTLDASNTYTAAFASGIESYAGVVMDEETVEDLKVTGIVSDLTVQKDMLLENGKEYTYEIEVVADENLEGRKVLVSSSDDSIVKATGSVVTDKDGKAKLVVKGYGIGIAQLTLTVEGTSISKKVDAIVLYDSAVVKTLQESMSVEIPESSEITDDPENPSEPGNDEPKDPSDSQDVTDTDISKAVVSEIANQVYNGSAITPDVKVTVDGKTLVKDTDYTVAYKNNTDAGTAEVTITGKGKYTGTKKVTFTIDKAETTAKFEKAVYQKAYGAKKFTVKVVDATGTVTYKSSDSKVVKVDKNGKITIKGTGRAVVTATIAETKNYKAGTVETVIEVSPKKASIKKLSAKKNQLTVTWKKDKRATGYEITYSTSKKFKKAKTVLVKKMKTTKTTLKKLKKGKTYYVKVRAYKEVKVDGKKVKIYSPYSKTLKKKVK